MKNPTPATEIVLERPHAEVRRLLATGAPVFLPVNPIEFHGPHLSLHNDALVSAGLIRALHAALAEGHPEWPLLRVRDLELGVDPVPGPGSRHVPYPEARAAVRRACAALADLGARAVVLVTFHGSPLHAWALESGRRLLERRGIPAVSPLNGLLREMLAMPDGAAHAAAFAHVQDPDERAGMVADLPRDFHAGFFETSMALWFAPESVHPRYVDLPPCPTPAPARAPLALSRVAAAVGWSGLARDLAYAAHGLGWYALRPFPGYTGRPHRATREAGRYFAELLVSRFAAAIEDTLAGRAPSPAPVLPWIRAATLGGRLPGPSVPASAVCAELPPAPRPGDPG